MKRDLTGITYRADDPGCTVATGTLIDLYTRKIIHFVRGNGMSEAVQIDHVVALANAWESGAQQISQQQRTNLANDPLNLLSVDGPTNEPKGKANAAEWLPPNKAYTCAYVSRQIAVKAKYHLWVTSAEKAAMKRVLAKCPRQKAPHEGQKPPTVAPLSGSTPPTASTRVTTSHPATATHITTSPPITRRPPTTSAGACEPGYSPCLPVTDDLNRSDIYDMAARPG